MYVIDLTARGTKCIELSQIFDSQGKSIKIDLYLSRAENKQGAVGVEAPKSVRIKIKDLVDGSYDKRSTKRNPTVDLD